MVGAGHILACLWPHLAKQRIHSFFPRICPRVGGLRLITWERGGENRQKIDYVCSLISKLFFAEYSFFVLLEADIRNGLKSDRVDLDPEVEHNKYHQSNYLEKTFRRNCYRISV